MPHFYVSGFSYLGECEQLFFSSIVHIMCFNVFSYINDSCHLMFLYYFLILFIKIKKNFQAQIRILVFFIKLGPMPEKSNQNRFFCQHIQSFTQIIQTEFYLNLDRTCILTKPKLKNNQKDFKRFMKWCQWSTSHSKDIANALKQFEHFDH